MAKKIFSFRSRAMAARVKLPKPVPWAAILLLALFAFSSGAEAETTELTPRPELLVNGAWLAGRLHDPAIRVVDLRSRKDYLAGHIPGAVHIPIRALSAPRNGVSGMLPPAEEVEATFRAAGIGPDTVVVGYDDRAGLFAARLFWALDYLGQGGGRILDGGWAGWVRGSRPVERDVPLVQPSELLLLPDPAKIATLGWVREHLEDSETALVDARHPSEFSGRVRYARKGGRIPGALLFNWRGHLDPRARGELRSLPELNSAYGELGLLEKREVVVYCQTLMRAAHSYFVLKMLGYPNVRGYDGSWAEWGNRKETPVETGAKPSRQQ